MPGVPRILLIGGAGQVGRELLEYAWPGECEVFAPTRSEVDLTDRSAVNACVAARNWTVVVNAAAYTDVDAAEAAVGDAFAANATGPAILAEATRRRDVPLIHISTDYVFDGTKSTPYAEDDAVGPLGVYGASKLAGEIAIRTGNPRHVIVRTSWVFGRYGANFVKTMLRLGETQDRLRVVDDQYGTPTAAADLAGAVATVAVANDLRDRCGTYHFANRGGTTWCGLAREVFRQSAALGGSAAEVEAITTADHPAAALRPRNSQLLTDKIEREWGIVPRPWTEPLATVIGMLGAARR